MNLLMLWDESGNEINLDEYGLIGLRLNLPSPGYELYRERTPGRPGQINLGKDLLPREITADFLYKARDYSDSLMIKSLLFNLFNRPFYIAEKKGLAIRWLVECNNPWIVNRANQRDVGFSLELICDSGMAESIGTTANPFEFTQEAWGIGIGLTVDNRKYSFNTSSFQVYNAGTEVIDPRYLPLEITFRGVSTQLGITNNTTGDAWRYTGTSNGGDVIKLSGIRSTKNNLSIFRDTNKKLITIAPGINEFAIMGATGEFTIDFNFRHYYV